MRRPSPLRILVITLVSALASVPIAIVGTSLSARGQDRQAGPREEQEIMQGDEMEDVDDQDVESEVRSEGGAKVKAFKFSGLDVSGRLKSPQLLYFLNRLRAEFDRPRLPHRSFIPELQRSSQGKAFR